MSRVSALYYFSVRPKDSLLDKVGRAERRLCETIFSIDPNAAGDLFEPAGISVAAWKEHVLERHGVDLASPDKGSVLEALKAVYPNMTENYLAAEVRRVLEHAEIWSKPDDEIETWTWSVEEGATPVVSCEAMEEVLATTRGLGLPFIAFAADADRMEEALGDDNEIRVEPVNDGDASVMFGLYDPVNGAGHFVSASAPVLIRPAVSGTMVLGSDEIAEVFGFDPEAAPEAGLTVTPGEPLRFSSRSEETMRFGAPSVWRP